MPKNPSLDVREVFRNPKRAIAVLKAGNTIVLIDDDGVSFARVIPEVSSTAGTKKSVVKNKIPRRDKPA